MIKSDRYHKILVDKRQQKMELEKIKERITLITSKRESLLRLLEQPDLGTLRIDVNQALEELDDLIPITT
ncbi:MAG: hypothetical protein F6K10_25695 [Moorea sp. SIO2B7]|nr:hypothetical protein [Moorena sp. SIO2B7]